MIDQAEAYPRGWFQVANPSDLAPGTVEKLHYFGQELVLFRTESGYAHVFDAHCAHLGAHLAVGGVVKDECLRCPFHGWEYDSSGQCVAIPNSNRNSEGRLRQRVAHRRAFRAHHGVVRPRPRASGMVAVGDT